MTEIKTCGEARVQCKKKDPVPKQKVQKNKQTNKHTNKLPNKKHTNKLPKNKQTLQKETSGVERKGADIFVCE